MGGSWEGSLLYLHDQGWNSDDIDSACEALADACLEGEHEDLEIDELEPEHVRAVLGVEIDDRLAMALTDVAWVRAQDGPDASSLAEALFDLDAFADAH